jgi:urease accessory protein
MEGWQGNLQLTYRSSGNNTQLVTQQATAPLKVQRSFYPEGDDICHNIILHTAGGIVGGDRLQMDIALGSDSHTVITTPAASKIYGCKGTVARQEITHHIATGATLEWLPQETIIFDGAIWHQKLRVNLAPNANWLGWEINRFGRTARGEKFTHGDWKSATEVYRDHIPLWIDRQWLPGGKIVDTPHGLAGYPIAGTLAWIGQSVSPELTTQARSLFAGEDEKIGVTRLPEGLLCRYRGASTTEVRQWFIVVWHLLRHNFFHTPPVYPRVWQ